MYINAIKTAAGWKFVVPSALRPGTMSHSLRSFSTQREAIAAAKKEYRQ